jgi:hypothetical protein
MPATTSFGLITEGVTDQAVIENVIAGCFEGIEPDVRPFQPLGDETYRGQHKSYGGWEQVLAYCTSTRLDEAFQFVDFIIVHIDTDRCEDAHFDVSKRHADGSVCTCHELIVKVAARLREAIGDEVWARRHERIVFAIAVDSTECWLLPLYAESNKKNKQSNCLEVLNRALAKKNLRTVGSETKTARVYDQVSRPYSKHNTLMQHYRENDSLAVFVESLSPLEV